MKKFTKLFLSCAAMAAVTAAVATTAMAADITGDITGTFDEATKKVTITSELGVKPDTDVTFLVFKGTVAPTVDADDAVMGIDQAGAVADLNSGLKDKVAAPAEGEPADTYTVALGYYPTEGDFTVKYGTFKLGTSAAGEEITIGDVDFSGAMNAQDAAAIARKIAERDTLVGKAGVVADSSDAKVPTALKGKVTIGDIDLNGSMNAQDSAAIARKIAERDTLVGLAGEKITVVMPAE